MQLLRGENIHVNYKQNTRKQILETEICDVQNHANPWVDSQRQDTAEKKHLASFNNIIFS